MRAIAKLLKIVLAVALIASGGWLVLQIVEEVLALYSMADSSLKLGVVTAGGSALAFVINNAIQSSRERRARLFESKREAYSVFFKSFMSFFHAFSQDKEPSQGEMIAAIQTLSTDVMTWGSAETVNAFNRYQKANAVKTDNQRELFNRTESFLRALRKDLGHDDLSLSNFALTKLLVKGDEHDKIDNLPMR